MRPCTPPRQPAMAPARNRRSGRIVMTAIDEHPPQARAGSRLEVRALVVYFALAYGLSWLWVIPLAAGQLVVRRGEGWPTHYPALLGPAIAAVVVTAWTMGRPGVRD